MKVLVLAVVAAMLAAPAALADWRLDPPVRPANHGIYRCTPRWARTVEGGVSLCSGRRAVFRTPIIDPVQSVSISGFHLDQDRRHGIVDYRIHLEWDDDSNVGYTTDRVRFRTADAGRHWMPVKLRRQDSNRTKPAGGPGTKPASDRLLPVKPCVWKNYARPWPHHPSPRAFGNTCIPVRTADRFSL